MEFLKMVTKIKVGNMNFLRLTKNEWNNYLNRGGFPYEYVYSKGNHVYFKDDYPEVER